MFAIQGVRSQTDLLPKYTLSTPPATAGKSRRRAGGGISRSVSQSVAGVIVAEPITAAPSSPDLTAKCDRCDKLTWYGANAKLDAIQTALVECKDLLRQVYYKQHEVIHNTKRARADIGTAAVAEVIHRLEADVPNWKVDDACTQIKGAINEALPLMQMASGSVVGAVRSLAAIQDLCTASGGLEIIDYLDLFLRHEKQKSVFLRFMPGAVADVDDFNRAFWATDSAVAGLNPFGRGKHTNRIKAREVLRQNGLGVTLSTSGWFTGITGVVVMKNRIPPPPPAYAPPGGTETRGGARRLK